MKILDFGASTTRFKVLVEYYQKNCDAKVFPVDKNPKSDGVIAFEYKGKKTPLPFRTEEFDKVMAISVLQYVNGIDGLVKEFARVLRYGGELVLTWPSWLWDEHKPSWYCDRALRKANFQVLERCMIGGKWVGYYFIRARKEDVGGEAFAQTFKD